MKEIIKLRRFLHQIPEPGNREFKTSKFIFDYLRKIGLNPKRIGTSVFCLLKTKSAKKTIAIRADIDGLPIKEENKIYYRSRHKGFMHACGHDAHMAILLSIAKDFYEERKNLTCNIKFIFQAAEEGLMENNNDNPWGARFLIRKGILKNPRVDKIIGFHVHPTLPVGKIQFEKGIMSRFNAVFSVSIFGRSSHVTKPHFGKDTVLPAAQIIVSLNNLKSRLDPFKDVIIGIGKINAGTKDNIVADRAVFTVSIRTYEKKYQDKLIKEIKKIIYSTCKANRVKYKLNKILSYPGIINDKRLTNIFLNKISDILGRNAIVERGFGSSEDFSFFSEKIPGFYFLLGSNDGTRKTKYPVHTGKFNIAERVLAFGKKVLKDLIKTF